MSVININVDEDEEIVKQVENFSFKVNFHVVIIILVNGFAGRNKPLNRTVCQPKWKSDVPITETQLRRKREEYWDTGPLGCLLEL